MRPDLAPRGRTDDRKWAVKPTGGQDIDARYRTRKGRVDRVDRVDVPKLGFATVDGAGGPDGESIADAVSAPTGAVLVVGEVPDVLTAT
jgi:hypothetical protein